MSSVISTITTGLTSMVAASIPTPILALASSADATATATTTATRQSSSAVVNYMAAFDDMGGGRPFRPASGQGFGQGSTPSNLSEQGEQTSKAVPIVAGVLIIIVFGSIFVGLFTWCFRSSMRQKNFGTSDIEKSGGGVSSKGKVEVDNQMEMDMMEVKLPVVKKVKAKKVKVVKEDDKEENKVKDDKVTMDAIPEDKIQEDEIHEDKAKKDETAEDHVEGKKSGGKVI